MQNINLPFESVPQELYTRGKLFQGFRPEDPGSWTKTADFAIYRYYVMHGGAASSDPYIRMMQALHDNAISQSVAAFIAGRRGTWLAEEGVLDDMERRNRMHPEKLKCRMEIVEHPFWTIKLIMNQENFIIRRLKMERTEMSLTVITYNMKRAMNILGAKRMVQALAWTIYLSS
jgi:hypothetical protein